MLRSRDSEQVSSLKRPFNTLPQFPVALPPSGRSRIALGLTAAAALGRFELQVCRDCGAVQYPPRESCHRCLSPTLDWTAQSGSGELISETTLFHSNEPFFRRRLPCRLGLVRLDCGANAVTFINDDVNSLPARVRVSSYLDWAGSVMRSWSGRDYRSRRTRPKALRSFAV